MNLSHEEATLFFTLMWKLQFYVNGQLNLVPGVESAETYATLKQDDKCKVRQALYERPDLIDTFVAENPAALADDDLRLVGSWKRFVSGSFFIVRYLKRYAVFVSSDKSSTVYGVLGLYDSLDDVLGGRPLPVLVEAVLLPFKGRIIYDGLLLSKNIFFGGGIRGELNETYQAAKQKGEIIESFEPRAEPARKVKPKKPARDWGPALDSLVEATEQMKQSEPVMLARALSVLKASARLAQAAAHDPDNLNEIAGQAKSVQRALKQLDTALSRAGWYEWQ